MSDLVDKWNTYKNALRSMLTKPDGTVDMEDGTGTIVTLPSFPALQKQVNSLIDAATGAVAATRASASSAALSASSSDKSATDAASSAAVALMSKDNAALSETNAARSEANAAASLADASRAQSLADEYASHAASSASASKASETSAAASSSAAQSARDSANASQTLADQYSNAPLNAEVTPGHFSAYHWSEQARLNALGALIYKGAWDASIGAFPAKPKQGDFYLIKAAGSMGGVKYGLGDMMLFDGSAWDRVDNQQTVTAVAGRVGSVTLTADDIGGGAFPYAVSVPSKFVVRPDGPEGGEIHLQPGTNSLIAGDYVIDSSLGVVRIFESGGNNRGVYLDLVNAPAGVNGKLWHSGNFDPTSKQSALGYTPVQQGTGNNQTNQAIKLGWAKDGSGKLMFTVDASDQGAIAMENWANGRFLVRGIVNNIAGTGLSSGSPPLIRDISSSNNNYNTALRISNAGNQYASAVISFLRDNSWGAHFGLDQDNVLRYGGWSHGSNAWRVVHEGLDNPTFSSQLNVNNADIRTTNWVYASNFQVSSDKRLKSDDVSLDGQEELANIKRLIARQYTKAGHREFGFFAQDVREVYPTMVKSGEGAAGDDTLTLSAMELLAPIVAAIQHLDRRITRAGL